MQTKYSIQASLGIAAIAFLVLAVVSPQCAWAQVVDAVGTALQNQVAGSTGARSGGGLSVSEVNGNVSYAYPISSYTVSGYPMSFSLNYCGGVAMSTFTTHTTSTVSYCNGCDGWKQFNTNQPAWLLSFNGFAVQALTRKHAFFNDPSHPPYQGGWNCMWMIDGYDFCNRMNRLSTAEDQDVIKILMASGGVLTLRNARQVQDIGAGQEASLYTGYYYSNSVNSKGFGIVEFDSSAASWPLYARNIAAPAYPQRYAYVPRVLKYYTGDGLEYVFREHVMPYAVDANGADPNYYSTAQPTIFYLEEVNSSLRTLVRFKRQRHTFADANERASGGRAPLVEFDGHRITYGENSVTIEALGRTVEMKLKAKWDAYGEISNSLEDECILKEIGDEAYSLNTFGHVSVLYFVTSIRDPEGIRDISKRRATVFDYERITRTFSGFDVTVITSPKTFAFYRLSKVTEPSEAYNTITYLPGTGTLTAAQVSGIGKKIHPDLGHVASDLKKYDKSGQLLAQVNYLYDNAPAGYTRKVKMSSEDKITNKKQETSLYYTFYDMPAYKDNQAQKFMTPTVTFSALEKTVSTAGTVTSTALTSYSNTLSGASRFVWLPVTRQTLVQQGGGSQLTTSYNTYSYTFAEVNDFGGDDSLRTLFGRGFQSRTTQTHNPAHTSTVLMKGTSNYINLPLLSATVTRVDSIYNEQESRLQTDAARRSGQKKTVQVFTTQQVTGKKMKVPPIYGLLESSYAIDPPTSTIIAGVENTFEWYFMPSASPVYPRGALKQSWTVGQNGLKVLNGTVQYSGGWYRNIPRSGLNVFGAKGSAFLDYATTPSLLGNYPTGVKVRNDNSTTVETLYREHHLFETPVASEQYVRYWDPATSTTQTLTLTSSTERTFHGQVAASVDANGWYHAAEYDYNGRATVVRHPFDFPSPQSCIEIRDVKLNDAATALVSNNSTLDCATGTTVAGHASAAIPTPYRLRASHIVNTPDSCYDPVHNTSEVYTTERETATIVYTAASNDAIHTASSPTAVTLQLHPTAMSPNGCATVRVRLRELNYADDYTFSCPPLDKSHPGGTGAVPWAVDLMPVLSSLQSMAHGSTLHIDISMETPGAWAEFATYADDIQAKIAVLGTYANCEKNDYTYAFGYDDMGLQLRTYAKVDDGAHTTTPGWSATWSSHAGRYSGGKDFFRSDGGLIKSQALIGHPDSPTRVDEMLFSLSGVGQTLEATDPLGYKVSAEYDDLGRLTKATNADNTMSGATYEVDTQAAYGISTGDQEFYGVCVRVKGTDENGKNAVSYSDAFGRVRRTVEDYGKTDKTTRYNYDAWGRLYEVIAPNGVKTEYFYDAFHRIKYKKHPDAGTVSYSYDKLGQVRFVQSQEQAEGERVMFTEYDDVGRPTVIGEAKVTGAGSGDNQGGAPSLGRLTEKLDPNILHIPLSQQTTPTVNRTLWSSTTASIAQVWNWGLLTTTATCLPAASAEAQEEVSPIGPYLVHPVTYASVPAWVGVAVGEFENVGLYPQHVLSAVQYDALPAQQGAVWQYFPAASVWNALAPKGTVRNLKGRQSAVAYRDHGGEAFHYVVTSYDERGRVEALLRYTENVGYDAVYYTYNSANQVLSVRVCDPLRQHATWYGYDANGRMEKMWSKLGAVGTGVGTSSVAHPVALTKPSVEDMTYSYDRMGRIEQMVYTPENIVAKYEYHKRGWLDSMFAVPSALPTDTLFKQSLSRDAMGRIVGQRSLHKGQSALAENYKYDALNQLIEWSAGGVKIPYSYDDVGNRLSDEEQGATRSYSYSGAKPNQLTSIWSGTKEIEYGYDRNGSATSRIVRDNGVLLQEHRYTYTSGGLVRKFEDVLPSTAGTVCAAAGVSQNVQRYEWGYRYSASGGREQKRMLVSPHGDACGSSHVWGYYLLGAGGEPLAVYGGRQTSELLCSGTGRRVYMYAESYNSLGGVASVVTRADGSKELNLTDHLGSVRTVIKSGGALTQYDYKPYGALRWSNSSGYKREGYIGKEEDKESGLGDYGVRKYDPTTGRFMSVDALYEMQMGWSSYHYAYNDPVNGSDGSGLFTQSEAMNMRVTDVGMGDYDDGFGNEYGSWGIEWLSRSMVLGLSDPLGPAPRVTVQVPLGFDASSGGGRGYHGVNDMTMSNWWVDRGGGSRADATSVAPNVERDVSGALAGFSSGRGGYRDPILLPSIEVGANRVAVMAAMGDAEYLLHKIVFGDRVAEIGGQRFIVDKYGYSTGRPALVTGVAPTPGMGKGAVSGVGRGAQAAQGLRGLWKLTDEGASVIKRHFQFGKIYKSKSDGLWWAVDNAGHGGSKFKVFKEGKKGLEWFRDADEFGDFILKKHKSPTGMFIPWGELKTIK